MNMITSDVAADCNLWDPSFPGRISCPFIRNNIIHSCCHISDRFFEVLPVVCEDILIFHSNLYIVTQCDAFMQVFEFNIITVILPLIWHVILRFHKCRSVDFKLVTKCSSTHEHLQEMFRDSHPFCVVSLTEKVTPHIVHACMGIVCFFIGLYVEIGRGVCGFSLHVIKVIDVINIKFIVSQ